MRGIRSVRNMQTYKWKYRIVQAVKFSWFRVYSSNLRIYWPMVVVISFKPNYVLHSIRCSAVYISHTHNRHPWWNFISSNCLYPCTAETNSIKCSKICRTLVFPAIPFTDISFLYLITRTHYVMFFRISVVVAHFSSTLVAYFSFDRICFDLLISTITFPLIFMSGGSMLLPRSIYIQR